MTATSAVVLREMRWWDIGPVLELEHELFPEDAWSAGMFWSELAHARGPGATRRYVVAEEAGGWSATPGWPPPGTWPTYRPSPRPATSGAPGSAPGC